MAKDHPRLLATQGALLLLQAHAAKERGAQGIAVLRARAAAFTRAVAGNPLLRADVRPLLDEAARFAEGP